MSNVHFILQGKGGCGKSLAATLLAQYLKSSGRSLICADTDPVNATFTQYKSLDVAHVDIARNGTVVQSKFDQIMQVIMESDCDVVMDNGASTFLPLTKYLAENDIFQIFAEAGKRVFVHSILTSGQAKTDTFNGFRELVSRIGGGAKIVVWENEFWGPIDYEGHPVQRTAVFRDAQKSGKIAGCVKIVDWSHNDAFAEAVQQMTQAHLTLDEVQSSEDFNFVVKNRLRKVVGGVFNELDQVAWQ